MTVAERPAAASRVMTGPSIFAEMSALALQHGAVNLGQGFPDFAGPAAVKTAAIEAIAADHNQYARMAGLPALASAIADTASLHHGRRIDPATEVTVFSGATEALFCSILALCEAGDEVVLLEPFYDSYLAAVRLAGAIPRIVTLHADRSFRFDPAELHAAFGPRTRAVLVNTPHNPTGRVLEEGELSALAAEVRRTGAYVIADEVYEHIVFDGRHRSIATLPGLEGRTATISSSGKTFSLTGWKVGWAVAPPEISAALRGVHQFVTFATATPLQHAIAAALSAPRTYYEELAADYRARRDRLSGTLAAVGLCPFPVQGTYFVIGDARRLGWDDDVAFCRFLVEVAGVAAIPLSAFYESRQRGSALVRFAFCKRDETLAEADRRLRGRPLRRP